MTIFPMLVLLLFYLCNLAHSFYIQTKRFDYDPYPVLMYNQMYSREHWRPYQREKSMEEEDDASPTWEPLGSLESFENLDRSVDKRVTADQINSLLKNAWLG